MPAEPTSSSGRRPTRSISEIATSVATMLMTPEMTEILSESSSLKPTACHRIDE